MGNRGANLGKYPPAKLPWRWAAADRVFLAVLQVPHRRDRCRRGSIPTRLYKFLFDLTDGCGWPLKVMRRWVAPPQRPEEIFARERERVEEGLHGGLSEAPLALMGSGLVEFAHPEVEVGLEVLDRLVELLAEGDAIELVEHGLVESLDDAVGLRALGLGWGVVDVLDRQIELRIGLQRDSSCSASSPPLS